MINPTPYNSTQLALLRSENQLSRLYLAVLDAPQVFACQINQDFDTHDMVAQAAYDNPVGNYADVLPGQTALIGSAPGLADLGICRIRKPLTSNQLYFGETSEIAWANNLHVTVVDDLALWARHIRIVDDVPLMDYDIAYANQHSVCDPVPVLGPHAVAWLEGGNASVQFDAGPSWVIGSTISAYAWSVSPAAGIGISGANSATPTFTISQPGTYRVRCLVTAANGASFAGYRYIFAFDDEHPAFSEFALKSCLGDDETGGWSFKIATPSMALAQALQPGRLVILFERAMYGNQAGSVGAIAGRENILATGWVTGFDDKEIDPEQDGYTFDIQGAHWWLKQMPVFPFGLELKNGTPTNWTEMQELTVDKALWHLLHWRSTATAIMDVVLTGDTRYAKELSAVTGSLWEQIETVAKASILAQPFVNQLGQMFVKIPVNLTPVASRASIPNILDIQPGDRAKSLSLPRARQARIAHLDLLGVAVSSTGTGSGYRSLANGNVPKRVGSTTIKDHLLLSDQGQSNELAGLLMADMNNPFPSIPVRFKANLRGFDMAPPMTASISLPGYTGKIIPKRIEYRHSATTGKLDVDVEFKAETTGTLSVTGILPVGTGIGGSIIMPPYPPLPPPPQPPINQTPEYRLKILYALTSEHRVFACTGLFNTPRIWVDITPDESVEFVPEHFITDWVTGAVYAHDGKDIYRGVPQDFGGILVPGKLTKWIYGTSLSVGGNPANNVIHSLTINEMTTEMVVMVSNTGTADERFFFVGSIENIVNKGSFGAYSIWSVPMITIGNGRIIVGWMQSTIGSTFRVSDDGGSTWITKNTTTFSGIASHPARSWHIRPNPIGNDVFHFASKGAIAVAFSSDLCENSAQIDDESVALDMQPASICADPEMTVILGTQRLAPWRVLRSLNGGITWGTTEVVDGDKKQVVWAGRTDDAENIFVAFESSNDTSDIVFSVDNFATETSVGLEIAALLNEDEYIERIRAAV